MEMIEKRLKDYKDYQVFKVIDYWEYDGTKKETIIYMLNDDDGNNINCFSTF